MQIPLFPLHTVLSPGLALPLHVFEDRYRLMVRRCLDESTPFGVVLIREGSELAPRDGGPQELAIASVGHVRRDPRGQPLCGRALGPADRGRGPVRHRDRQDRARALPRGGRRAARRRARRRRLRRRAGRAGCPAGSSTTSRLLQPRDGEATTPIDVQVEVDVPDDDEGESDVEAFDAGLGVIGAQGLRDDPVQDEDSAAGDEANAPDGDGLASALRIPDDPSHLSFLLTGILQVEPFRKQKLLEATTAEQRLRELDLLLDRELMLLRARLAPYSPDRRALGPLAS